MVCVLGVKHVFFAPFKTVALDFTLVYMDLLFDYEAQK